MPKSLKLLRTKHVIELHGIQVHKTAEPSTILQPNLLESAVAQAKWAYCYQDADVFDIAAVYAYHLARNHAFLEGNKRTAAMAAHVFLKRNGISFQPDQEAYVHVIESVVLGTTNKRQLASFFRRNTTQHLPLPPR